ncbi:MAG TPA: gephyrin-like molybdotransferase Glp [Acidobacteriaceae bacterium]|nr:gephyrin-like molybdotransferase Glp [Acidobacteriaceae bacterium]
MKHPAREAALSFAEAFASVAREASFVLQESSPAQRLVSLVDTLGRVLAAPIFADREQPPFDRSTRDGYAVRAEDIARQQQLRILGEIRAGEAWPAHRAALGAGEAVEIMTGAPLPPGANAVLMVEHVELDATTAQLLPAAGRALLPGANVVPCGSEAHSGELLVPSGTRIGASQIAVAASCGRSMVSVYAQPRVAILATGDELIEPDDPRPGIAAHQIFNSNSYSTAALVAAAGAIPLRLPIARDRAESIANGIRAALDAGTGSNDQGADLLLLSGGVSMGKYDLVEQVLADMGAELFFTGVRIQPGKPLVFGRIPARDAAPARYFFGLPGNPLSTMVTFALFVRPLLAALAGEQGWQPSFAMARLTKEVRHTSGLTRFLPARLDRASGDTSAALAAPTVTPIPWHGSGDLAANARANCYLVVPEEQPVLAAGSYASILLLEA